MLRLRRRPARLETRRLREEAASAPPAYDDVVAANGPQPGHAMEEGQVTNM